MKRVESAAAPRAYPDVELFGSALRTATLVSVALLKESHLRELARVLGTHVSAVQRVIRRFEKEGVIASRISGSERRIALNRTYYAYAELHALLLRIGNSEQRYLDLVSTLRRRPRRSGK